ncbi:MAG: class I SAM-dependent methyltransferase [Phycisphaerales bacterium]|nr:class I SAM-dependent methyltransferase [Phycisphaerales bacterium]
MTPQKSTVEQIRQRFDCDVERFSNLQTGQSATMDAPLVLDLLSQAAAATTPQARHILDVGCGAGNHSLCFLSRLPGCDISLVDLSRPMLDRARQRLTPVTTGALNTYQEDIRNLDLPPACVDVIVAAAVLHHLRTEDQWRSVFAKFYRWLRPGGSLWISDLITHRSASIQNMMWQRYGNYLISLKPDPAAGQIYRDQVFAYIEQEDTPQPLMEQLDLLHATGFINVEILHKNTVFAAFGAVKP